MKRKEKKSEPSKAAFDYDLILDPTISTAIQASLVATPHEGFKPVVSVSKNGTLKIDFVPNLIATIMKHWNMLAISWAEKWCGLTLR